jgi:hypothetical protein
VYFFKTRAKNLAKLYYGSNEASKGREEERKRYKNRDDKQSHDRQERVIHLYHLLLPLQLNSNNKQSFLHHTKLPALFPTMLLKPPPFGELACLLLWRVLGVMNGL